MLHASFKAIGQIVVKKKNFSFYDIIVKVMLVMLPRLFE